MTWVEVDPLLKSVDDLISLYENWIENYKELEEYDRLLRTQYQVDGMKTIKQLIMVYTKEEA